MKKILYVEDDETLAFLTTDNLSEAGYAIHHQDNGMDALNVFKSEKFDLCILDVMLPKLDGFSLAVEIRKLNQDIPILFLSAKTLKEDRLHGLRLGADDYLVKPFSIEELLLKIEIFLNRAQKSNKQDLKSYSIGKFVFYPKKLELHLEDDKIKLTKRESELLLMLVKSKDKLVKKEAILLSLWGDDDYFMGRSLDVFISKLRKIFSVDKNIKIENYRSVGFCLSDNQEA